MVKESEWYSSASIPAGGQIYVGLPDKSMDLYSLRLIYHQYKDTYIKYYLNIWKNYCMYNGDRSPYVKSWQRNIKSGMTLFFSESIYSALLDSDIRYIVWWRDFDDQDTGNIILEWIEYLHTRNESDTAFRDALKEVVILGTGFFKMWYRYREIPFDYLKKDGKTKKGVEKEDFSTLEFMSATNVIVDQTARSEEDARFWIVRKIIATEMIKEQYSFYNLDITDEIVNDPYYVDFYDYDRFKRDLFVLGAQFELKPVRDEVYYFVKERNCEVFEVYERWMLSIFINGHKFWPFAQIGPWKRCPYRAIQFIRVPWSIYGIGVGTITSPMQEVFDGILNSRMDNVSLVNNKIFIHVTSLDPLLSNKEFLELEPWLIIHTANKDALQEFGMSDIKQWPIIESGNLMDLTMQTLGTNGYQMGNQDKVERSAFGVEALQKSALSRIKWCIKSISKAMAFAAKYQLILSLEYTEKSMFERVLGKEWAAKIQALDIEDVINDVDFDFSMDAMKVQSIANKMNQSIQLLTLAPKLVDAAGNPLVDVWPLFKFVLQWMWMDENMELTEESIGVAVKKAVATKKMFQDAQAEAAGQWWPWWVPTGWQAGWVPWLEQIQKMVAEQWQWGTSWWWIIEWWEAPVEPTQQPNSDIMWKIIGQ